MAAELVETTRLWARTAAGIEAGWVEEVGGHLIKRTYSEPHWSQRSGTVQAYERLTLLGVPIVANRAVDYARINRSRPGRSSCARRWWRGGSGTPGTTSSPATSGPGPRRRNWPTGPGAAT